MPFPGFLSYRGIVRGIFVGASGIRKLLQAPLVEYTRQTHSRLLKGNGFAIKLCAPQSLPKDIFRKFLGNAQAHREMRGALALAAIGIKTPKPVACAFSLNPFSQVESIYAMEFIENTIPSYELNPAQKQVYHKKIIADLEQMKDKHILFKDLRFHNILFTSDEEVVWIDTDVKVLANSEHYKKAFAKSLERLLEHCEKDTVAHFCSALQAAAKNN